MDFDAKMLCDSISPAGKRLSTMALTYPRFIHSEILTHRDRARNSASSRAIPWPKMRAMIQETPVIPIRWGSEAKGMQTGQEVCDQAQECAKVIWLKARDAMLEASDGLAELGVHKSLCNRLTEPFMWITVIMTATEWKNFFRLRCHADAEIHFQKIAGMARDLLASSVPEPLPVGAWHLPLIQTDELTEHSLERLAKISTARCARVSYLTHEGKRDWRKDLDLFEKLVQGSGFGHWSPHEHIAVCQADANFASGPFRGYLQYRKMFANENEPG